MEDAGAPGQLQPVVGFRMNGGSTSRPIGTFEL